MKRFQLTALSTLLLVGVLCFSSCRLDETQSITIPISCYKDYDEVEIQLTNLDNNEVRELEVRNRIVDFGELVSGRYEVSLRAWQDGYETERVRFHNKFNVPNQMPSNILSVPRPGIINNTDYSVQNFTGWVNLDVVFDCEQQPDVFQWYHISIDSSKVFSETEGVAFEGNQLSFEPEFAQPFYIGFERWTDNEERGYTTFSEVMLVDLNSGNHQNIEVGELVEFEILESNNMYFSTLVETGEVYKVDYYDRGNGNYTADAIVFGAKDYFSEGRTASPHGRGRVFQAIDETLNLQASRALEGAFGSSALRVSRVENAVPLTFSDSMDFSLSTKNTTYVVETFLNPGIYTFHGTHTGYNPEMAVAATLVFEHPFESVVGGSMINIGPVGNFDPYTETRKFAVNEAGTLKIYLLTGYHGGVADYSCSVRAD